MPSTAIRSAGRGITPVTRARAALDRIGAAAVAGITVRLRLRLRARYRLLAACTTAMRAPRRGAAPWRVCHARPPLQRGLPPAGTTRPALPLPAGQPRR